MSMDTVFALCLDHIKKDLIDCTRTQEDDCGTLIGLPHPYVVPNCEFFGEMYYWDSYFVILGLVELDQFYLAKGIVENCLYLIEKFGFVPNANRTSFLTRSQPPFLTSMINEVYRREKDKKWLEMAFEIARKEYTHYWNVEPHFVPEIGLNRYYDRSGKDEQAEDESGWDLTPRFLKEGTSYCPIDLNCYLFKYEIDFSKYCTILGNINQSRKWMNVAEERKKLINRYMWEEKEGLFYDYNFVNKRRSPVKSLASYVSLWCNLATRKQAKKMVEALDLFEYPGGLAVCDQDYGMPQRQWNYPNGWPPLEWLTIVGLRKYGYIERAHTIQKKWIRLCVELFEKTGHFWEKYDVVQRQPGSCDRRYETQKGFSWTNAILLALCGLEREPRTGLLEKV